MEVNYYKIEGKKLNNGVDLTVSLRRAWELESKIGG